MPGPFELAPAVDRRPPVLGAGRDDHRPGRHLAAVVQARPRASPPAARSPATRHGIGDAGAELLGLHGGEVRQVLARRRRRGSRGSSRSVLDVPACPPTDTAFEHDGVEALGRAVHGGGQPGRPRADDHEVEDAARDVLWKVSPRCSASSPAVGFRSTSVDVTTTGVSSGRRRGSRAARRRGVVVVLEVDPLVGLGRPERGTPRSASVAGREP